MRRGQALKFQKDFKLAKADFIEAKKIQNEGEADAEKWLKFTEEDEEHQNKLNAIMANAEALKGKEYIDYLINFLKGKKDDQMPSLTKDQEAANKKINRRQVCFHELNADECNKLSKVLDDEKMVYYFNVNEGFKVLIDSLYFSTSGLKLIKKMIETHPKL